MIGVVLIAYLAATASAGVIEKAPLGYSKPINAAAIRNVENVHVTKSITPVVTKTNTHHTHSAPAVSYGHVQGHSYSAHGADHIAPVTFNTQYTSYKNPTVGVNGPVTFASPLPSAYSVAPAHSYVHSGLAYAAPAFGPVAYAAPAAIAAPVAYKAPISYSAPIAAAVPAVASVGIRTGDAGFSSTPTFGAQFNPVNPIHQFYAGPLSEFVGNGAGIYSFPQIHSVIAGSRSAPVAAAAPAAPAPAAEAPVEPEATKA